MIKKLLFTVAVLTAGLAYGQTPSGQTPSASFSDQVVPAGSDPIACDIGPPYQGSIPAPAVNAGYTHCAANYDFTQTQVFNNGVGGGSGYQWSNLGTWFNCRGASSPGNAALWYQTQTGTEVASCPGSDFSIITDNDPTYGNGQQTFHLEFSVADFNNSDPASSVNVQQLSTYSDIGNPTPPGAPFPNSGYFEYVFRFSVASFSALNGGTGGYGPHAGGFWHAGCWATTCANPGYSSLGMNLLEIGYGIFSNPPYTNMQEFPQNVTFGIGNHGNTATTLYAYHTWGNRFSADNSTGNFAGCAYLDGVQGGCQTGTFVNGASDTVLINPEQFYMWTGPNIDSGDYLNCVSPGFNTECQMTGNMDSYWQRITIWVDPGCANVWVNPGKSTASCNTGLKTSNP
jgi:hypothetical protein